MPIMVLFRSKRIDQRLYDAIIHELDLEHRPEAGMLTHACGFDGDGICVMDVWESRMEFETFMSHRLKPAFAKLGLEFVEPAILDAYKFGVAEGVDRYRQESGPSFGAAREGTAPGVHPPGTPH